MVVDFSSFILPKESKYFNATDPLDLKICKELIACHNLATIPMSSFYTPENRHHAGGMLRLCFCKTDDLISDAEKAIRNLAANINKNKL